MDAMMLLSSRMAIRINVWKLSIHLNFPGRNTPDSPTLRQILNLCKGSIRSVFPKVITVLS